MASIAHRPHAPRNAMTIERRKGEALWSQIAGALTAEIEAGRPAPGARLATEAELAARFAVNRHTIRRALEELAAGRLIRTEHGRGSFVTEEVLDYRIGRRPRFTEWIASHNRTPLGEILVLQETDLAGHPEAAAGLGLSADAPVIFLERLGSADARPIALSRHFFIPRPGLLAALSAHNSITAALAAIGITAQSRCWTRVTARLPDAHEARHLRMARTDPLLTTEALNKTPEGPVEYGQTSYPAARVQLVFEP